MRPAGVRHPPGNECSLQNRFLHCLQVPLVAAFRRCLQPSTGHFAAFSLGGMGPHRREGVACAQPPSTPQKSACEATTVSQRHGRRKLTPPAAKRERPSRRKRAWGGEASGVAQPPRKVSSLPAGRGRPPALRPHAEACVLASKAGWALSRGQIPRRSALQQKSALRQNLWGGTLRCAPVPAYEALRTGTARQILALVRKASGQGALEEVVPFARRAAAARRRGRPRSLMAHNPRTRGARFASEPRRAYASIQQVWRSGGQRNACGCLQRVIRRSPRLESNQVFRLVYVHQRRQGV